MVSRRKILSRSRDELHSLHSDYLITEQQDDVWLNKEKLFSDHITEVLDKWTSIDDEIWAKIIVLERNRRVAKAYARAPVLTVNGSNDGFDGFRIGVNGFDNPMRDAATKEIISHIGQGFKLKMDEVGNILIKRVSKSGVRIRNCGVEESAVSNDVLKLPGGLLEMDKPFKIFDMKKFQQNMNREIKRSFPDRRKLEAQCISMVSFGGNGNQGNASDILNCPIWILIINIVAIEMLKSKMPNRGGHAGHLSQREMHTGYHNSGYHTTQRPRSMEPRSLIMPSRNHHPMSKNHRPLHHPFAGVTQSTSSDEDPYSIAGSGESSGSSGSAGQGKGTHHTMGIGPGLSRRSGRSRDKPPKLPPRDASVYSTNVWGKAESKKSKESKKDDPYYSGLRARIPNFVSRSRNALFFNRSSSSHANTSRTSMMVKGSKDQQNKMALAKSMSSGLDVAQQQQAAAAAAHNSAASGGAGGPVSLPPHPFWWHSRFGGQGAAAQGQGGLHPAMSMGDSHHSTLLRAGGTLKRNPTNFVPYINTANGSDRSGGMRNA